MNRTWCAICKQVPVEPVHPDRVCDDCDKRAKLPDGRPEIELIEAANKKMRRADGVFDMTHAYSGTEPVFIDGIRCVRRFKNEAWITMADPEGRFRSGNEKFAAGSAEQGST